MQYDDFVIQLVPKGDQEFWVTVLGSAAGDNSGIFRLPFDTKEIRSLRHFVGQAIRGRAAGVPTESSRDVSNKVLSEEPSLNLQQIGGQLFQALFSDEIRSLLDRSLGSVQQGQGLRIKIHLDPDNSNLAELCNLPWELLFWKGGREFLSLNRISPIVRSLATPHPSQPLKIEASLRILVVISSPPGVPTLDTERERLLIQQAWGHLAKIEIQFLEHPTLTDLHLELLDGAYHILHYIGHGSFDNASGEGGLVLADCSGLATTAPGLSVADALRSIPSLRLVFLNACDTAVTTDLGLDPFGGVAAALVKAGLPAVLAMQFPISDQAAVVFSQAFYRRLASGDPVEVATVEGRLAIRLRDCCSMEWVTPVLFLRTPADRLVEYTSTTPPISDPVNPGSTRRVGQLEKAIQFVGKALDTINDWEEADTLAGSE